MRESGRERDLGGLCTLLFYVQWIMNFNDVLFYYVENFNGKFRTTQKIFWISNVRNTNEEYLFEQQKKKKNPVLDDKRQKLTQASKENILKYKVRK